MAEHAPLAPFWTADFLKYISTNCQNIMRPTPLAHKQLLSDSKQSEKKKTVFLTQLSWQSMEFTKSRASLCSQPIRKNHL